MNNIHSLCLVGIEENQDHFYRRIGDYLAEGYMVVLAVGIKRNDVINRLLIAGIDAEEHITDGTLTLLSSDFNAYDQYKRDKRRKRGQAKVRGRIKKRKHKAEEKDRAADDLQYDQYKQEEQQKEESRLWQQYLLDKIAAHPKSKGILTIGNPVLFLGTDDENDYYSIVAKESHIGRTFGDNPVEVICCYSPTILEKMPLTDVIDLLRSHECTLHTDWKYKRWRSNEMIQLMRKAIGKLVGNETCDIIFATLKLIYKMDYDAIILNPALFKEKIEKLIGPNYSTPILEAIRQDILREIQFYELINNNNGGSNSTSNNNCDTRRHKDNMGRSNSNNSGKGVSTA